MRTQDNSLSDSASHAGYEQPVREVVELDVLYAEPSSMIQKAVSYHLTEYHRAYLEIATFFCLATGRENSGLDASPRGGPPGFVHMLDAQTLAFADWPGNNRIESLKNLQDDDRVAMLFLFPGLDMFMRINGRGRVSTSPALLDRFVERGKHPKTAVVVTVEEALFHCGKAVNRARLWDPGALVDQVPLPTVGTMLVALAGLREVSASALDAKYQEAVKHELY